MPHSGPNCSQPVLYNAESSQNFSEEDGAWINQKKTAFLKEKMIQTLNNFCDISEDYKNNTEMKRTFTQPSDFSLMWLISCIKAKKIHP